MGSRSSCSSFEIDRRRRLQIADQERIASSIKTPSPAHISHLASFIVSPQPDRDNGGGSKDRWRGDHVKPDFHKLEKFPW
jgi:hypothetical protein